MKWLHSVLCKFQILMSQYLNSELHLSDALLLWLESNTENLERPSKSEENCYEVLKQVRLYSSLFDIKALNPFFNGNSFWKKLLAYRVIPNPICFHLLNKRISLHHVAETRMLSTICYLWARLLFYIIILQGKDGKGKSSNLNNCEFVRSYDGLIRKRKSNSPINTN